MVTFDPLQARYQIPYNFSATTLPPSSPPPGSYQCYIPPPRQSLLTVSNPSRHVRRSSYPETAFSGWGSAPRVTAEYRGTERSTQERRTLSYRSKDLPMIVQGTEVRARHDTGAESGNFISYDTAKKLQLGIQSENSTDCKKFKVGAGKIVRAIGVVKAQCAFAKELGVSMECWFHVFRKLASPMIMGADFLEKTKTLTKYRHRLENRVRNALSLPTVNLIGSTEQDKRCFSAYIDNRPSFLNADSGSDLDVMSWAYVKRYGYYVDRRQECCKRVQLADCSVVETIGQVQATLRLQDGSSYEKAFDVLPGLTSEVILGEETLEDIDAFTVHQNSFVDVFAGKRHFEFSLLGYLGPVSQCVANKLRSGRRESKKQQPARSHFKQQDDAVMEALHAEDLEAERLRAQNEGITHPRTNAERSHEGDPNSVQLDQAYDERQRVSLTPPAPTIPPRSARRGGPGAINGRADTERRRVANS